MPEPASVWQPLYTLTPAIARRLMEIEAARALSARMPLPVAVEAELRRLDCQLQAQYRQCIGNATYTPRKESHENRLR